MMVANAQYSGPGYYRVHNVDTDHRICIRGTHFEKTTRPDAFWPCAVMEKDIDLVSIDPGGIIYIPDTVQVGLYAQGVDTYTLTGLPLDVELAPNAQPDMPIYVAHTIYNGFNCYFRDCPNGMSAGSNPKKAQCQWWIEPVNASSIDTSFFAVKPISEKFIDAEGWYWTTLCCDFPFCIPEGGGVEGAYTITEIELGSDSLYYANPVKLCGQGDTVPAATPVLLKCASLDASGNKLIPVGKIANCKAMPITHDMLMGNYFSAFTNYGDLINYSVMAEYIPEQATLATPQYLALSIDDEGKLSFMPQQDGTYMKANTAWLNVISTKGIGFTRVILGNPPVDEPEPKPEPLTGDIDGDGSVDVNDITYLINILLQLNEDSEPPFTLDVNGDGAVDVSDVTTLIATILTHA